MRVSAAFIASAADAAHFPPAGPPEIAFLGRSNVGKSSLINSLVGEKIAKTSSTPGRTRAINFFAIRRQGQARPDLVFADLPGYGYAKLPREVTAEWPKFIEPYLEKRATLALCVVLVDPNVPPQDSDRQLIDWLNHQQLPFVMVTTKADKLSGNQLQKVLEKVSDEFGGPRILSYSARTGMGREDLWREIQRAAQKESR